jgi:glycerol-3-phosphate dehydrogenase
VSQATVDHLTSLYGSRAADVLRLAASNDALAEPLAADAPDITAQVAFSVRTEQCLRLSDFLLRRTRLGFSPDLGRRALPRVATWMARELCWDEARRASECEAYLSHVARTQAFRAGSRGDAASPRSTTSSMASRDLHSTSSEEAP